MSHTIYKLYLGKVTEAWHTLSETEQHTLLAKVEAALKQAKAAHEDRRWLDLCVKADRLVGRKGPRSGRPER